MKSISVSVTATLFMGYFPPILTELNMNMPAKIFNLCNIMHINTKNI